MSERRIMYQFRIDADARAALEKLPVCVQEANPIPERKRGALRFEIRDLWRALTMERSHRNIDYLNNPAFFSAYLRYFLPWNLVRLIALLTDLPLPILPHSTIGDIGAGPLTFAIALYCAKPQLRKIPLTFLCADRTPRIMEAGKLIFETLAAKHAGELPPWTFSLKKAKFGEPLARKADFLVASNVINEFFWNHEGILTDEAFELYGKIARYCEPSASILVVEPGEPRSGSLMSALRAAALMRGDAVQAPCPHSNACPMPGIFRVGQEYLSDTRRSAKDRSAQSQKERRYEGPSAHAADVAEHAGARSRPGLSPVRMPNLRAKYPWCHFSIDAAFAPAWLSHLSEEAGLAKEKLSFSFLFVTQQQKIAEHASAGSYNTAHKQQKTDQTTSETVCRIISDPIVLPMNRVGRYACAAEGYTLIHAPAGTVLPESGSLVALHHRPSDETELHHRSADRRENPRSIPERNSRSTAHDNHAELHAQDERKKSANGASPETFDYDQKSGAILVSY